MIRVFAEELVAAVLTALFMGVMIAAAAVACDIVSFGA